MALSLCANKYTTIRMDAYDAGDEGITRSILNNLCFAITDKSSQAEGGAKIDANDLVVHKKIFPASANLEVKCEGPAQNNSKLCEVNPQSINRQNG